MTSPQVTARQIQGAAGVPLRLWEHPGPAQAPRVLFVHGYLDQGRSYDALVERLGGAVRAACLDWRGHGQSRGAGPGASYHLLDHVKDLCAVLRHLEERPALVVAHSMGGNVALLLAGSWPGLIPRLLLLDSFGPPSEEPQEQPARLERLLRSLDSARPFSTFASRQEAVERILSANPGLSRQGAQRMAEHGLMPAPGDPRRWTVAMEPALRGPTPVRWPESTWLELCRRVQGPVRLLRAEHGYVPAQDARLRARLAACPGASMLEVPGAYHNLHVDAVDTVAEQVLWCLGQAGADFPSHGG